MIVSYYNYVFFIIIMVIGLYIVCADKNMIKKLFGLSIFQTSVLLFYISLSYVKYAYIPILNPEAIVYSNPLPHVLMLTAIVVGVATLAVGLSLVVRIEEEFKSIEETDVYYL